MNNSALRAVCNRFFFSQIEEVTKKVRSVAMILWGQEWRIGIDMDLFYSLWAGINGDGCHSRKCSG